MKKNKKKILIAIIISICIIIIALTCFFILHKPDTGLEPTAKDEKEIVRDKNDNRAYPLVLRFYSDKGGACYKTINDTCVNVYKLNKSDKEYTYADWGDMNSNILLGEYTCKTDNCFEKDFSLTEQAAVIIDDDVIIYDFKSNKKYETGIINVEKKNILNYNYKMLSNVSQGNYKIAIYDSSNKTSNVYSTTKKSFVFDKWYNNDTIDNIDLINNWYLVSDIDNDKSYFIDENGVVLSSIQGVNYNGELINKVVVLRKVRNDNAVVAIKINDLSNYYELKGKNYKAIDNYLVTSDSKDNNQIAYIYDINTLKLLKTITNGENLDKQLNNNNVIYTVSIDRRGGNNTTTKILDSKLNVIIDEHNLPANYADYDDGMFSAVLNKDGTISIQLDGIYVYDLKGNLLRVIRHDKIIGFSADLFVIQEDNKILLMDYNDNTVATIVELENGYHVHNIGEDGYYADIGWEDNENYFVVVAKDAPKCKKYIYSLQSKKVILDNSITECE